MAVKGSSQKFVCLVGLVYIVIVYYVVCRILFVKRYLVTGLCF